MTEEKENGKMGTEWIQQACKQRQEHQCMSASNQQDDLALWNKVLLWQEMLLDYKLNLMKVCKWRERVLSPTFPLWRNSYHQKQEDIWTGRTWRGEYLLRTSNALQFILIQIPSFRSPKLPDKLSPSRMNALPLRYDGDDGIDSTTNNKNGWVKSCKNPEDFVYELQKRH